VGRLSTNMGVIQSNCFEFNDSQTKWDLLLLMSIKQFTAKQQKHLQVSVTTMRLDFILQIVLLHGDLWVNCDMLSLRLHSSVPASFISPSSHHVCLLFPFTATYCAAICGCLLLPPPNFLHGCCTIHLARSCTNTN
jgi:hypothetical protein